MARVGAVADPATAAELVTTSGLLRTAAGAVPTSREQRQTVAAIDAIERSGVISIGGAVATEAAGEKVVAGALRLVDRVVDENGDEVVDALAH